MVLERKKPPVVVATSLYDVDLQEKNLGKGQE